MRWFGWFRQANQEEALEESKPRRSMFLAGRRVLVNTPYVLPKDKLEGDRLDLQHHLLKIATGKNYQAEIRQPRAILDVACGTGIWAREMAQEFPRAQVVGFDYDRTPLDASLERLGPNGQFPANFRFLQADALKPFPFEDGEFDYVHARFISPFLPIARWPDAVAEMLRVLRSGGVLELADLEQPPVTPSPAFNRIKEFSAPLMTKRGLYVGVGQAMTGHLRQAGVRNVQERRIALGRGHQEARQQRLLIADMLSAHKNFQKIAVQMGLSSDEAYSALVAQETNELPRLGIVMPVIVAFGTKP